MVRLSLLLATAALWIGSTLVAGTRQWPDVADLSLHDILAGLADGTYTSKSLTGAYLDRINSYDGDLNAMILLNDGAPAAAAKSDRDRAAGKPLGPMAGVPIVIKESIDMKGFPSTMGWRLLSTDSGGVELFPKKDAAVVTRLLAAGAIILGKTNIPAFSDDGTRARSSWAGPTYNAVNRALAPGASSSGTASAVAAGFCAWGMAEETGGSIQNPAAAQSLVGIKTTFGPLVPIGGVVPLAGGTRDVLGPIARTVQDAAIALDTISGYGTPAFAGQAPAGGFTALLGVSKLNGKRVGLYGPGWKNLPLAADTAARYEAAKSELSALGAVLVNDPFAGTGFAELALADEPYDFRGEEVVAYAFTQYIKGLGVNSLAAFKRKVGATPFEGEYPLAYLVDSLPVLAASLQNPGTPPDLSEFAALKAEYARIFADVFATHNLDVLVFPHATEPLPEVDSDAAISETTVSAVDIGGWPLVTVPSTRNADGPPSPFSLVFVGPEYSEAELLALAYDYEQATHHRFTANL